MRVSKGLRNRLICIPESIEDKQFLIYDLGAKEAKDTPGQYLVDCNIYNQLLLRPLLSQSKDYLASKPVEPYLIKDSANIANSYAKMLEKIPLMEFQKEDVLFMLERFSSLNANEMGLGKTVESLAVVETLKLQKVLIIAPKSILVQWSQQIQRWLGVEEREISILPKDPGGSALRKPGARFTLVNYDRLVNKDYLAKLCKVSWDIVIADEAHRIKNRTAARTKAIKQIKSLFRIGLTGTPVLNKPDDLWSILDWLSPYYAGSSYWTFTQRFCEIEDTFFGQKIVGLTKSEKYQALLIEALDDMCIRNTRAVVLKDLPTKLYIPIALEMTKAQAKLYKAIKKLILDELPEDLTIFNAAAQFIRLQQVTSNPGLFLDAVETVNPKFDFIHDLLEDNPEKKILVYSKFAETIKAFNKTMLLHSQKYASIYGEIRDRESQLQYFINSNECRVMSGTIGALGVGVDGMQEICDTVIFIDRDYSPGLNEQAEDRLCRIGQTNMVKVYNLECLNSIDQYIGKIVFKKAEDIRRIFLDENS